MGLTLPLDRARCRPTFACSTREQCARFVAPLDRATSHRWVPVVDASICLSAGHCPMFIDSRGVNLLTTDDKRVAA